MLKIGFGKVFCKDPSRRSIFSNEGTINLWGREVQMSCESSLNVRKNGVLTFKGNFYNTAALNIDCYQSIELGRGMVVSWNTFIMDGDGHSMIDLSTGTPSCSTKSIRIGDRVWIGMNVIILKGATIGDGCCVAANAVVTGKHDSNTLIGGCPAKTIKKNVRFSEDYTEYTFNEVCSRKK